MLCPQLIDFGLQRHGDLAGGFVGNDRDAFIRLETQTDAQGILRARDQFGIDIDKVCIGAVGHGSA
jgi:hypothetical protein